MSLVHCPHDAVFKAAMRDFRVAKEFFVTHLPTAVSDRIDLDSLELQSNSYVDQSLKTVLSDVLYKVRSRDGSPAFLYLLCEHQSRVDSLMPFRIWQYIINIWSDYLKSKEDKKRKKVKLPLIYPLVFYSGSGTYTGSNDLRDLIQAPRALIDEVLFSRTFQLIDVNQLAEEPLRRQLWAGMLALTMKHVRDRDITQFLKQVMSLLQTLEQAGGTDYVVLLLNYCLNGGQARNIEEFVDTVQRGLSGKIGERVMTVAQQFIEIGKQEGIVEGLAKGKAEGKAEGEFLARRKMAEEALAENLPLATIQKLTHLTLKELKMLQSNTRH